MAVHILDNKLWFPDVSDAEPDGLLAIGGDMGIDRLLFAYRRGIFPWYNEGEPVLWWSPDPRFVLFPENLKTSKSMEGVIKRGTFEFRENTSFQRVIINCRDTKRNGQSGTWITDDIVAAYTRLHHAGYAHCAEAWQGNTLVGGLYGVMIGKVFFGESMFSHAANASKFAFINWVRLLAQRGVGLIDCQVYTPHLESLGACMIPRQRFVELLAVHIP